MTHIAKYLDVASILQFAWVSEACVKIVHQLQLRDKIDMKNVRVFDDDLFQCLMYYKDRVKKFSLHGSIVMIFPYNIPVVMAEFANMTHLELCENMQTRHLSFLTRMANLVSLKLECVPNITARDVMKYVGTCKNLQTLSLADNEQLNNVSITCTVGQLPNLKMLDVRRCDYLLPKHVQYIKSKCTLIEVLYFTPHLVLWSNGNEWAKITKIGEDSKIDFCVEMFDFDCCD